MRRSVFALLALAALLAVAGAPANAAPDSDTAPKNCLTQNRIDDQRIVDDHTIYFREGPRWYRNDLASVCPGLSPRKAFHSRTTTNQLCAGDIITAFEPQSGSEFGSCGLGRFTPATPPSRH